MTTEVLILVFAISVLILTIVDSFTEKGFTTFHLLITLCMIGIILFSAILLNKDTITDDYKPDAIEVYRRNAKLEITYRDSISIDTIVIIKDLKNKIK